jgi:hypothetical protein
MQMWPEPPWEGDSGGLNSTRRDEPIGVVIHIYIETTQGNSLCSYLYLKLSKTSYFFFYLLCFFFYKVGEQEGRTSPAQGRGGWHQWEGEMEGKR